MGENLEITSKGYLSLFDHEHMSKGITLHEKEMRQIFDLMKKRRMNNRFRKEESPQSTPQHDMPSGEQYAGLMQSEASDEPFDAPLPQEMATEQAATETEQAVF